MDIFVLQSMSEFGGGYVIGIDLEEGEEIIIQGTTTDGKVLNLLASRRNSPITGRALKLRESLLAGFKITAVDAKTGKRWI